MVLSRVQGRLSDELFFLPQYTKNRIRFFNTIEGLSNDFCPETLFGVVIEGARFFFLSYFPFFHSFLFSLYTVDVILPYAKIFFLKINTKKEKKGLQRMSEFQTSCPNSRKQCEAETSNKQSLIWEFWWRCPKNFETLFLLLKGLHPYTHALPHNTES